ncbi:MAG: hypothetical protein V7L21_18280 [Nostoc sp.]|uniref:calcium-binding protein n=1 Tax=unclassified Nostoc TaxID=2593658 RepID=UPI0025F1E9B6|nr:hypothetical protein [Nostoc sp. NMS9]MBN3942019.1 calcium-binding protein [Nostoc sp. NMS9]
MTYYYYGTSETNYFNYKGSDSLLAFGYEGNDTIYGNTNDDDLNGGNDNDYLNGWSGNDKLYGDNGNDTLYGYSGNDTLHGSYSTGYNSNEYDVLNGGSGYDTFVLGSNFTGNYYQGSGYATIQDYDGAYDYIRLKGSASSYYLNKTGNYGGSSALDTLIYQNNGDLLAIVQDNTSIQLTSYYFNFS